MKTSVSNFLKNLAALLFGCFVAAILIALFDVLLIFANSNYILNFKENNSNKSYMGNQYEVNPDPDAPPDFMTPYRGVFDAKKGPLVHERSDDPLWNVRTEALGFENSKNAKIRHQLHENGRFIFNVTYRTDEYGRRITPVNEPNQRDKFLIFFGCSFTWGSCLHESETVPSIAGQLTRTYKPYNYAKGGSSINWLLALLENRNIRKEIAESHGIGIYVFINAHIGRATGDVFHSKQLYFSPYYEIENGTPVRKGNFLTGREFKTRLYIALANSNLFKKFNLEFPIPGKTEYEFMCEMIEESKHKFLQQFPNSEFVTVFHPTGSSVHSEHIAKCLKDKNIRYIRFENFKPPLTEEEKVVKHDGHPSAAFNKYLTAAILDQLGISGK